MTTEDGTLGRFRSARWRRLAFWLIVVGIPIAVAVAATWLYTQDKYYEYLARRFPGKIFEMRAEPEKPVYAPGERVVLNITITYTAPSDAPSVPFLWGRSFGVLEQAGDASAYPDHRSDLFSSASYVRRKRSGKSEHVALREPVNLWPGDEMQFTFGIGPATEPFRGQFFMIGEPYGVSQPVERSTLDQRSLLSNFLSFDVASDDGDSMRMPEMNE